MHTKYDSISKEQTKTATELAYAEVINYNKKNPERELQNESRQHNRQQGKVKRRKEETKENARRLLNLEKIKIDEVSDCFPDLIDSDIKELEAEIMRLHNQNFNIKITA